MSADRGLSLGYGSGVILVILPLLTVTWSCTGPQRVSAT